jgi:hypothetical protein
LAENTKITQATLPFAGTSLVMPPASADDPEGGADAVRVVLLGRDTATGEQSELSSAVLRMAGNTSGGIMSSGAWKALADLSTRMTAVEQQGGKSLSFKPQTYADLLDFQEHGDLTDVDNGDYVYVQTDETQGGALTRYEFDISTGTFEFDYIMNQDMPGIATTAQAGLIKSADDNAVGYGFVDVDGRMRLTGMPEMQGSLGQLAQDLQQVASQYATLTDTKADAASVYTRATTDAALAQKANKIAARSTGFFAGITQIDGVLDVLDQIFAGTKRITGIDVDAT